MAIVGAFARINTTDPQAVRHRLELLEGVELFDLDEPAKVGILIEARDLDDAHATVRDVLPGIEGVLGVWPIYVHAEDENDKTPPARDHGLMSP